MKSLTFPAFENNMTQELRNATYAYGKLSEAVRALAIGGGNIKARLLWAVEYLNSINPEILPEEIRQHLIWVNEQLTKFKPSRNGCAVSTTLRKIRISTGVKIAERILLTQSLLESYIASQKI